MQPELINYARQTPWERSDKGSMTYSDQRLEFFPQNHPIWKELAPFLIESYSFSDTLGVGHMRIAIKDLTEVQDILNSHTLTTFSDERLGFFPEDHVIWDDLRAFVLSPAQAEQHTGKTELKVLAKDIPVVTSLINAYMERLIDETNPRSRIERLMDENQS